MSGKFNFRLQRVLEIRERAEQERARALSSAQHQQQAAEAARDSLAEARDTAALGLHAHGARPAGELRAAELVLAHMDRHVSAATAAAQLAAHAAEAAQLKLNDAFRDRRVLDRLKERALEAWQVDAVQADRQQMDAIALSRFGRRTPNTNDPVK